MSTRVEQDPPSAPTSVRFPRADDGHHRVLRDGRQYLVIRRRVRRAKTHDARTDSRRTSLSKGPRHVPDGWSERHRCREHIEWRIPTSYGMVTPTGAAAFELKNPLTVYEPLRSEVTVASARFSPGPNAALSLGYRNSLPQGAVPIRQMN